MGSDWVSWGVDLTVQWQKTEERIQADLLGYLISLAPCSWALSRHNGIFCLHVWLSFLSPDTCNRTWYHQPCYPSEDIGNWETSCTPNFIATGWKMERWMNAMNCISNKLQTVTKKGLQLMMKWGRIKWNWQEFQNQHKQYLSRV